MAKRTLGIDIQHDGLAWVVARTGMRQSEIEDSGWIPYPDKPEQGQGLVAALAILKSKRNPSGLACVVAVTGRDIVCRTCRVPFRDRKKIRQMLPLELEPTLPMPVTDLEMDFQVTGNTVPTPVLAVALHRSRRDDFLSLLQDAGIDPEILTFQSLPTAMLLARHLTDDGSALLVDVDRGNGLAFLIHNGRIAFIRSWRLPQAGRSPETLIGNSLRQTLAALSYQTASPAEIASIYLTPRAAEACQGEALAEDLEIPVRNIDLRPLIAERVAGQWPDARCQNALALCLYAPLADQGFNFYRTTFPLKKIFLQNKIHVIRAATLGILLVGLLLTDVALDIRRGQARLQSLDQTARDILTTTFPDTRNVVDPLQQMKVKLRQARNEASGLAGDGRGLHKIDLLNTVSRAIPDQLDIQLSQLVAGPEQMQLTGTTDTFEAVNTVKNLLEKQTVFDELTIVSANMDPTAERVRFKLSAVYKTP
jgi:type II secretion system protein L